MLARPRWDCGHLERREPLAAVRNSADRLCLDFVFGNRDGHARRRGEGSFPSSYFRSQPYWGRQISVFLALSKVRPHVLSGCRR